ncbi:MAG: TIGR00730 family Rossman fold protein [Desulfobacteraceae bacterium]|nr:TIGR00730 family Rossman fold protein [Desulfobacteraceae bacterium]
MKSICVFCGSSPGKAPLYVETAVKLGKALARRDIRLVYGGASVGTMGATAVSVLKNGGSVTGVITKQLVTMEVANTDLTDLRIVDTMHDRKAMMAELSDGFIALPGGFGTIEELFEAITWAQLGIQKKPCGILNVGGYYDKLLDFIDHMIDHGFVKSDYRELIKVDDTPEGLIEQFNDYTPVTVDKAKWVLSGTSPVLK